MEITKSKIGMFGLVLGVTGLMLALVHFWAGPFSPQPTLETFVAEKAASIRQAAIDALAGKSVEETYQEKVWDADSIIDVIVPVLGVLSLLLASLSFIKKEPARVAGIAAAFGVSAIVFQFIAMYVMALLAIMLIAAFIDSLGG